MKNEITFIMHNEKTGSQRIVIRDFDDNLTQDILSSLEKGEIYFLKISPKVDKKKLYMEPAIFAGCKNLREVDMSEVYTMDVSDNAFKDCSKLERVSFPERIFEIGISAFENCDLRELELPAGLGKICERAFANNTNLSAVAIRGNKPTSHWRFPVLLQSIGDEAFSNTTVPDSIETSIQTDVGSYVFQKPWVSNWLEITKRLLPQYIRRRQ